MNAPDFASYLDCPQHDRQGATAPICATPEIRTPALERVAANLLRNAWKRALTLTSGLSFQTKQRRLRVSETVSLGEKRFVSIIEVDGEDFLVAGGPSGVSLLAKRSSPLHGHTYDGAANEVWQRTETA